MNRVQPEPVEVSDLHLPTILDRDRVAYEIARRGLRDGMGLRMTRATVRAAVRRWWGLS